MNESAVVRKLFNRWEEEKIVYCHWKSIDHLAEALAGITDLDVLVKYSNSINAEKAIHENFFVQMKTAPLRQYPGVHDYIAYDSEANLIIHLHLHYQLVLGDRWVKAYRLPIENHILSRRKWVRENKTWIINPADELMIFCSRMCVKFKKPLSKIKIRKEFQFLAEQVDDVISIEHVKKQYPAEIYKFAQYILKNDFIRAARSSTLSRKVMRSYKRMNLSYFFFLSRFRLLYRIFVEFNRRKLNKFTFGRRTLPSGGIAVAFVGMDGSGKTSAITRNLHFFASHMDVQTVFLGSGQSGAPWYRKIAFTLLGTKAKFKKSAEKNSKTIKNYPIYYLLWLWLCNNERIKRISNVFKARSNGLLVLVDRWPQKTIDNTFDGAKLGSQNEESFFTTFVKKYEKNMLKASEEFAPDLILRFIVSPQKARERKPGELFIEEAVTAKDNLLKIKWPLYCAVEDIDADLSVDEVDIAVRTAIWKRISGVI